MNKSLPSRDSGNGVCGVAKFFCLLLTTASVQCLCLSERFFICDYNENMLMCSYAVCTYANLHMPCYLYAGSFLEFKCFEVKPEEECPRDDKPSTGMFAGSDEHLLFICTGTAFALMFQ